MSRYAIIPARSDSNRLSGKNIRTFLGRPIIAYSIETALASGLFSKVYVSAHDDQTRAIAEQYGAGVLDHPQRDGDYDIGTTEVMREHANLPLFENVSFLCCIYPCAPLMMVEDLHVGLRSLKAYGADYAFSVGTEPLCDAGAWYWGTKEAFAAGRPVFGPDSLMIPIPQSRVCDVNTERDWLRAELLYAAMHKQVA